MTSFRRALLYGFLVWLIPFLVAFLIFQLRESSRPLFESIMPVTLAMATAVFGVLYFKNLASNRAQNHIRNHIKVGLILGTAWWIMSMLIDAPLMLLGGPMQMTLGAYFADIGLTYMMMPVITVAIGVAAASHSPSETSDT